MKKIIYIAILLLCQVTMGQAKKPTLMVVPSDAWCVQHGFTMQFDDQGILTTIPDYKAAFQNDTNLLLMISKINGLMADRGFPLKNMETVMKTINSYAAEDAMRSSKETGAEVAESPVDMLKSTAKADIFLQLTYTVNQSGPKKSVTFNLQGLDAYSSKQVATAAGTGAPSFSAELPVLLEEAAIAHMDTFSASLQDHFDDMFENGREITVRIKRWDDWGEDLESEFGGDELGFVIEDWMADNTVQGRFSTLDATENMMIFEQVRIPMYYTRNGRERAMDTRRYIKELSDYLNDGLGIENKITTRGLGEATLFLGHK
ncbi:MAG: hypothetical protein CL868_10480 [Cytophagaceae bacterium]|nr:hypothetical protein [Cytophagaceae bacterium]|tara:strand:+ start:18437 stop:19387 length:951 start_codon:yes stop_codon:yes gene_type:complete